MSKYINKARHLARETSHHLQHAKDDVLKRQIHRERNKLPRRLQHNPEVSSFKLSDIDEPLEDFDLDKDLYDDGNDDISQPSSMELPTVINERENENSLPSSSSVTDSLFDDEPLEESTYVNEQMVSMRNDDLQDSFEQSTYSSDPEDGLINNYEGTSKDNANSTCILGNDGDTVNSEMFYSIVSSQLADQETTPVLASLHNEKSKSIVKDNNDIDDDLFKPKYDTAILNSTQECDDVTNFEVKDHSFLDSSLDSGGYSSDRYGTDDPDIPHCHHHNIISHTSFSDNSVSSFSSSPKADVHLTNNNVSSPLSIAPTTTIDDHCTLTGAETSEQYSHDTYMPETDDNLRVTEISDDDYIIPISLSFCALLLYIYYSLNPFVYLAGFMAGFFLFYITVGTAFVLYVQYSERERERRTANKQKFNLPQIDQLPSTVKLNFEAKRTLQCDKFGLVHNYHPSSHHPSQRIHAKLVKLHDDFKLEIRYRVTTHNSHGGPVTKVEVLQKDLRQCSVLIVPEEVSQNRKRRWSKKFPISISWSNDTKGHVFLFPFTSRDKEEWFRRLREASNGQTYDQLIDYSKRYYRYMGKYMPINEVLSESVTLTTSSTSSSVHPVKHHVKRDHRHKITATSAAVHFTNNESRIAVDDNDLEKEARTPLSFTNLQSSNNKLFTLNFSLGWINAGLARLAWDLWHEERWRKLVTSRIQRQLLRIKTPSFMEALKVTEVHMGMDTPVIQNPLQLPEVDNRGIWIYLHVTYTGSFTMTIETKLKLEPKKLQDVLHFNVGNSSSESSPPLERRQKPTRRHHGRFHNEEDEISSGSDDDDNEETNKPITESMDDKLPPETIEILTSSQGEDTAANTVPLQSQQKSGGSHGRKEKLLTNMVSKFQKIAAKSRIVAKAAEKVSSYPLVLTVEVRRLMGNLVLNMAPPPSDAIWFGFTERPHLELVATPKLGHREVTLSYVTDWIEKKLCEVVEKKLVLPNMEDVVIPVLNSGIPEDKIKEILMSP